MEGVKFMLLDVAEDMVKEWAIAFAEHTSDEIQSRMQYVHSDLMEVEGENAKFDCIVSPANSYGRLDGSFDHYLALTLAPSDEEYAAPTKIAQSVLYKRWRGYAPPGTCTLVPLTNTACAGNRHGCKFIALCPTMRTPERVDWNREIVYNCVWSLLNELYLHNKQVEASGTGEKITKVLMPGLGTAVGRVSFKKCAQQTALAFLHFEEALAKEEKWSNLGWGEIQKEFANDMYPTHAM